MGHYNIDHEASHAINYIKHLGMNYPSKSITLAMQFFVVIFVLFCSFCFLFLCELKYRMISEKILVWVLSVDAFHLSSCLLIHI